MQKAKSRSPAKWPIEEWREFDRLTSGESIGEVETGNMFPPNLSMFDAPATTRATGLLKLSELAAQAVKTPEELRHERLSKLSRKVKDHAFYKRLERDSSFKVALRAFTRLRKTKVQELGNYSGPYAELRFLNIIAAIVVFQEAHPDVRPMHASLDTSRAALAACKSLLQSLDQGVRLDHWGDNRALRALLDALSHKLESEQVREGKRRRRVDNLSPRRWYVDGLIGQLLSTFGHASPTIVTNIGAMMGYQMDPSTVERRIDDVTKRKLRLGLEIISPLSYLPLGAS